jgi:hypothetical protein
LTNAKQCEKKENTKRLHFVGGRMMEKEDIIRTLKEDLKVKKEIIAIKVMKDKPFAIPQYEGEATP